MPDVPILADTVPGYEATALFGMGAPKNTPKEIIAKLNKEINEILAEPAIKARLTDLGGEPLIGPPEAFGKMIAAETDKWEKVVEAAGREGTVIYVTEHWRARGVSSRGDAVFLPRKGDQHHAQCNVGSTGTVGGRGRHRSPAVRPPQPTITRIASRAGASAYPATAPTPPMHNAWRRLPAAALYCNINPRVAFGQLPPRGCGCIGITDWRPASLVGDGWPRA